MDRNANTVKVRGHDAIDDNPILDIKPYICSDIKANIGIPQWERLTTANSSTNLNIISEDVVHIILD